jgi:acetolactate synthase-1/3 small subunit
VSAPHHNHDSHAFSLVTRDRPGVLVRIALVFARRGFNIESLAVSPGAVDGFARMTITSRGDPEIREQMVKQLYKLVDVVFVADHGEDDALEEEIALIKLRCDGASRKRADEVASRHGATLSDDSDGHVIYCFHGTSDAIDALVDELEPYGVDELVRSGKIVIDRGASRFHEVLGRAS